MWRFEFLWGWAVSRGRANAPAKPSRPFTCRPYSGAPAARPTRDAAGANAAGVTLVRLRRMCQRTGPRRLEREVRRRLLAKEQNHLRRFIHLKDAVAGGGRPPAGR